MVSAHRPLGWIVLVTAAALAGACSDSDKSAKPADKPAPAAATPGDTQPGKASAAQPGKVAAAGAVIGEGLRQFVAEPVAAAPAQAPAGLYDALVSEGGRWELVSASGNKLMVENHDVRTVGKARVAKLRWTMHRNGETDVHAGGWPRQVMVTDKGLTVVESATDDDAELAGYPSSKPTYADPPLLAGHKERSYARVVDDMVCLGFDFWAWSTAEDICGDESCVWRVCLRDGQLAGADWGGVNAGLPEFVPPGKPSHLSAEFTASSEHAPWKEYEFNAAQIHDRSLATSWQPAKGKSVGEWVEMTLPGPVLVDVVEIANGYQYDDKLGDLFLGNARVRRATITLDGTPAAVINFEEKQRGYLRVDLGGVPASKVRLTIDAVWPGKKWQDVAISELALIGRPADKK